MLWIEGYGFMKIDASIETVFDPVAQRIDKGESDIVLNIGVRRIQSGGLLEGGARVKPSQRRSQIHKTDSRMTFFGPAVQVHGFFEELKRLFILFLRVERHAEPVVGQMRSGKRGDSLSERGFRLICKTVTIKGLPLIQENSEIVFLSVDVQTAAGRENAEKKRQAVEHENSGAESEESFERAQFFTMMKSALRDVF